MKYSGGLLALIFVSLTLNSCSDGNRPKMPDVSMPDIAIPSFGKSKKAEATVDFNSDVKPILEKKCLACHNSKVSKRGLNLENREVANKSWRGGAVVIPEKPEQSMLYQISMLATGEYNPHKLTYEERKIIYAWIDEGAHWPSGTLSAPSSSRSSGDAAPIFGGGGADEAEVTVEP